MQSCWSPQASLVAPNILRRRGHTGHRCSLTRRRHSTRVVERETCKIVTRMAHTVFVYGTLLSEEIVKILLNRNPESHPATAKGYSRYSIKGRVYPAILPTLPSDELTGLVLCGLSDREFEILDEYEDEDYYRTKITAYNRDASEQIEADIYVWKDSLRNMLYGSWDYEEFRRQHLKEYMVMCEGFGADFTSKDMVL